MPFLYNETGEQIGYHCEHCGEEVFSDASFLIHNLRCEGTHIAFSRGVGEKNAATILRHVSQVHRLVLAVETLTPDEAREMLEEMERDGPDDQKDQHEWTHYALSTALLRRRADDLPLYDLSDDDDEPDEAA